MQSADYINKDYGCRISSSEQQIPKKRIIITCDGTWMDSDAVNQVPSNVTRILRSITSIGVDESDPENPKPIAQVTFYQHGVGTGDTNWYYRNIGKYLSGATGDGMSDNIREAYSFLCNNYHDGDEIILIGFSRGAFTARSISTLIHQVGLLTPKGLSHITQIFKDWKHQYNQDWKPQYTDVPGSNRPPFGSDEYRFVLHRHQLTRHDIPVKAIALWDTVGALGVPSIALFPQLTASDFAFLDNKVPDNIEYAFQALGLDEKRRSYAPTVYSKPNDQELPRVLKQTWFPGVHADIGGSYANDDLANITLAWMVGQLEEHKLITFDREYLIAQIKKTLRNHDMALDSSLPRSPYSLQRAKTFGAIRPWGLGKIHDSYTPFFKLGGAITRKPMEHFEVLKDSLESTERMLEGTCESMHASVRVRMALNGLGYNDEGIWESDALEGWEFEWNRDMVPDTPWKETLPGEVGKVKGVEWVKMVVQTDGSETELRMPEDEMTEFERLVLRQWTSTHAQHDFCADRREQVVEEARPKRRESKRSPGYAAVVRKRCSTIMSIPIRETSM